MAKLRHIAICVTDLEKSARFYENVFGLTRAHVEHQDIGSAIYLTDGVVNLALIRPKDPGKMREHFGFVVDDLDGTQRRIEQNGGKYAFTLGHPERKNFEIKFTDPEGRIFDISRHGWFGAE
jgi:predicted enzyme related to lactoylglutathione lyase